MSVRCESIDINLNKREILKNISIEVNEKEILSIIGPNGAGKSTLLKSLAGDINPINGNIFYDERMTTLNSLRMENPDLMTRFPKEFNSAKARAFYY